VSAVPDKENIPQAHVHGVFDSAPPEPAKSPGTRATLRDHLLWPAVALFIICFVTTAALAATNAVTRDPIRQQAVLAEDEARRAVLTSESFSEIDLAALAASDATAYARATSDGKIAFDSAFVGLDGQVAKGVVVKITTKGYGKDLKLIVGLAADGTVSGVRILSDNETPGLGKKIADPGFLAGFLGKSSEKGFAIRKNATGEVVPIDAITGATISSRAVVDSVNAAAGLAAMLPKGGA
jgi:electron transport complex protein RnfG